MIRPSTCLGALLAFSTGCAGAGDGVLDMFDVPTPAPSPGFGWVSGEFGLQTIDVRSAISESHGSITGIILLSDEANICDAFSAGYQPYGARYLFLQIFDWDGANSHPPQAAGEYSVVPATSSLPKQVVVWYIRMNYSQCSVAEDVAAASGTVILSDVSAELYAGEADFVTEAGDEITAAFNPTACQAASDLFAAGLPCQ